MVYPIQFAFPVEKLPEEFPSKSMFFSDIAPEGRVKKYKFNVESEYYAHYGKAFFAVTTKKGGWDCLRHYEIVASGTLPYFVDIESCPRNTLFAWPKELLTELKHLPGMPNENKVIKHLKKGTLAELRPEKNFDEEKYWNLHRQFMSVFREQLTTRGLSDYFLKTVGLAADTREKHKILLCFGVVQSALDYQRDLLISALANDPRVKLTVYPWPYWHSTENHRAVLNTLYGRGFTCTATVPPERLRSARWGEIAAKLDDFNLIVACSSSNFGFAALPPEVQAALGPRQDIIWIDGNDIKADHSVPSCARLTFRREMP